MTDTMAPGFDRAAVEILDSEICHAGFLRIDRLKVRCRRYAGGWSEPFWRELLRRPPGIGLLLYDPCRDMVLLVEQFRPGCLDDADNGPWSVELVAGVQDRDESDEDVARREAEEEAGVTVADLLPIGRYYNSPGGSNERLSLYCAAFDATRAGGIHAVSEEHEDIRTIIVSRDRALSAIASGRVNNAMSIIALQWLQLNLEDVRRRLLAGSAESAAGQLPSAHASDPSSSTTSTPSAEGRQT